VAFSPDGTRILVSSVLSPGGGGLLLDLEGRVVTSFALPRRGNSQCSEFSPEGDRILMAGGMLNAAFVWHVASGRLLLTLEQAPWAHVNRVAWSRDGKRAITASANSTLIWDLDLEEPEIVARIPVTTVDAVEFCPTDSGMILTVQPGAARLWRLRGSRGEVLAELRDPGGNITCARFRPDGKRVVTATTSGTVRSWSVDTKELLEIADGRAHRDFRGEEKERYRDLLGE
jgi:WD40 repeat protein